MLGCSLSQFWTWKAFSCMFRHITAAVLAHSYATVADICDLMVGLHWQAMARSIGDHAVKEAGVIATPEV